MQRIFETPRQKAIRRALEQFEGLDTARAYHVASMIESTLDRLVVTMIEDAAVSIDERD